MVGFYTNTFMASLDEDKAKLVQMAKEKVEVPKKLKMRSLQSEEEDLSTRIQNLYLYFDDEKFLSEISQVLDELKVKEVFESSLKDNDGKIVKFVLVENFNSNNNSCKKVRFNEPLRLSNIDEGTEVTLDLCKINENYELSAINLTK